MRKTKTFVTLAVTALATLFIASSTIEPAAAKQGGHSGGGKSFGGGGKSFGGSMRSFSGNKSFGGSRQFSRTFRSPSFGSSRVYGYRSGKHHRHHGHRHFRGRNFVYGYPVYESYYGYSDSCYWLRRRALATGSSYWWNRYYDCINDY
jgi:hypothetical protein